MEELRLIAGASRTPLLTMRDLLAVVFRQFRVIVISFLLVLFACLAFRLLSPSYRSEMKILVSRGREDPALTPLPAQNRLDHAEVREEDLNSEVELLHDQEILKIVTQAAGLFPEPGFSLRRFLGESDERRLARAVRQLDRRLCVAPSRKTTLITVTYQSSSPVLAAAVLKCLAGAYLERHSRLHRPVGETGFFDQQIEESRRQLEAAELRLMDFTRSEGIVSASQQRDISLQKLGDAEATDRAGQVEIAATRQRVRGLQLKLHALPERATTVIRNSDNPELLGKIKARLLELQLKRTELLTRFEPSYRLVQEVDQQIAETKGSIAQEELTPLRDQSTDLDPNHAWAKGELLKAELELSTLQARAGANYAVLAAYQSEARDLGERAIKQEELLGNLKAVEQQYLLYVSKREEARIGDALDAQRILNVAIAEQPTRPALPMRSALGFAMLTLCLAGTVSTALAFVLDRLNPAFRTPDEVVMYLGAPVLASLPRNNT